MRCLFAILALVLQLSIVAQTNGTCATAPSFVDGAFIGPFQPTTNWVELYYQFTSPGVEIDFTFIVFADVSSCPSEQVAVNYMLYNSNCDLIATSPTGEFQNLIPNQQYILGFTASCPSAGISAIQLGEDIILPVRLLNFSAELQDDCINLKWTTATERNCAGFLVQRSVDVSVWLDLAFVVGAVDSQQIKDYSHMDSNPIQGVSYYRLVQFDLDGSFEILRVIAIFWSSGTTAHPLRQFNLIGQKVANYR